MDKKEQLESEEGAVEYKPNQKKESKIQKASRKIMLILGVTCVGIGENETIVAYVLHTQYLSSIPEEIDGFEVIGKVSGLIKPAFDAKEKD